MLFNWIFQLFGCPHNHTSFPITPVKSKTYVVCLDCGKEFDYNWKEMKIGSSK